MLKTIQILYASNGNCEGNIDEPAWHIDMLVCIKNVPVYKNTLNFFLVNEPNFVLVLFLCLSGLSPETHLNASILASCLDNIQSAVLIIAIEYKGCCAYMSIFSKKQHSHACSAYLLGLAVGKMWFSVQLSLTFNSCTAQKTVC